MRGGWLDDRRYRRYHAVALLIIPLLQRLAQPSLFVTPGGPWWIDPWVYTGFFLSLPSHLHRFPGTYYGTRLTWLLPGFALHSWLPPLVANDVLHLALFYALLFATYGLVASGVNRSAAFLVTLLVAWNPAILRAVGWDYVDGAGILFLVVTMFCLERVATGRRRRWSIAAGAAAAALVVTNLALILLLPACLIFFRLRTGPMRIRETVRCGGFAALGAGATLLICAIANRSLGGSWLFLAPSIRFYVLITSQPNRWRAAGFQWSAAYWVAVPLFASAGALLSVCSKSRSESSFPRSAQAALLAAVATWVGLDVFADFALMQYFYYVSYLATFALIALPLQTGTPPVGECLRATVTMELLTLSALAVAYVVFVTQAETLQNVWSRVAPTVHPTRAVLITWFTTMAGATGVLALRFVRPPAWRWAMFVAGMALSAATLAQRPLTTPFARADFEQTVRAHRFIGDHIGARKVRFWYPEPTLVSPPFRAIASTYLWQYVLINEELPRLATEQAASLDPTSRLVLLLNRPGEADEARSALQRFGFDYSVVTQQQIGSAGREFQVVIADLVPPKQRVAGNGS
jgi:hypothetical protein